MADKDKKPAGPRSLARLAAVQAIFQLDFTKGEVEVSRVISEFTHFRFKSTEDDVPYGKADRDLFRALVEGLVEDQITVDAAISQRLTQGWRLDRLDSEARAILRAGAYELLFMPETPVPVVIKEYADLAASFLGEPSQIAFVNSVLDKVAAARE